MSITLPRPRAFSVALALLLSAAPVWAQGGLAPPPLDDDPPPPTVPAVRPGQVMRPAVEVPPPPRGTPVATSSVTSDLPGAPADAGMIPDSFLPTLMGPIGLYNISTAEVGPAQHLRLALHGQYFESSGFLVAGDQNSRMNGNFSFGYTPHKYVEIFGAILTSSNRNERNNAFEPPRRDPALIKSFGDLVLGGKGILPVAQGMTVGFELGLRFLSSISDLSISPSSTSMWLGPLFTYDVRQVSGGKVPLRLHASASYYIDNSDNLINFSDPTISKYTREVAMFAYGIARNRLRFALGIEAPLEAPALVPLTFFGEYHAEIVTATADPAFVNETGDTKNRDQHWATIGMRARVYKGITLDVGTDIRIRSVGYEYGTPLPPWNLIFGVAYPFDIASFTRPVVVTQIVERNVGTAAAASLEGQVTGIVKSARDGRPIAGAIVSVARRPLSRVATDPDGKFQTVPLPPGPVELEIGAPGFDSTKVPSAVILGRTAKVDVTLAVRIVTGNVRGTVKDGKGHPLPAALRLAGAEIFSAQADATGQFSASLPVGAYRVTAEMPQMAPKEVTLDIVEGQDRQLDIVMGAGGAAAGPVPTIDGDLITTKPPIKFTGGSRLDPKTQAQLNGVAELLQARQDLRLRIETFWDSSAGKGAQALTDSQAKAIKAYLVKKGVSADRIEAVGHGAENPVVPNIGPVNKAKNRRVELHVQ